MFQRVLVITDNLALKTELEISIRDLEFDGMKVDFAYSSSNSAFRLRFAGISDFPHVSLKDEWEMVAGKYDLIISAHCKQIFPGGLVNRVRCVNLHPGLNPHNRGWYPQVFAIVKGTPLGATLHEMDEQLDHGPIIDQEKVNLQSWDTSLTAYLKVRMAEVKILRRSLRNVVLGRYTTFNPITEGSLNSIADFAALKEIDLCEVVTMQQAIDRLRALTHGDYKNAFFKAPEDGRKVYVQLSLTKEDGPE